MSNATTSIRSLRFISTIWSFVSSKSASESVCGSISSSTAELEYVAHVHAVKEDVGLTAVRLVPEQHPRPAMQLVEPGIRFVSQRLEEPTELHAALAKADKIQIGVGATQVRLPGTGTAQIDRPTADQAQRDIRLSDRSGDANRLFIHVCQWLGDESAHKGSLVARVILSMAALKLYRSFTRS